MTQGISSHDDVLAALDRVVGWVELIRTKNHRSFMREEVDRQCMIQTRVQALFNSRFKSPLEQQLYETILSYFIDAEKMAPGGFDRCTQVFLERFRMLRQGLLHPSAPDGSETVLGAPIAACRRTDINNLVSGRLVAFPKLAELVKNAIELGGFRASIVVEPTVSHEPSLELVSGYTFDLQPAFPIRQQPTNPRCACIDGYVETVSELHHMLIEASETRDWVVVFLRGMADDVKHTLKVNHDRGTLNVIPVVVDFDLAGLNTLNDISVITGSDLISSNKGDMISSIRLGSLACVDRLNMHDRRLVMRNAATKANVQQHLDGLRKRRADEVIIDIGHLLDGRIKSLSSNHVILRLPQDRGFVVASQAIDDVLRGLRCMIEHGLTSADGVVIPTLTLVAAKTYAERCVSALATLGCVVTS